MISWFNKAFEKDNENLSYLIVSSLYSINNHLYLSSRYSMEDILGFVLIIITLLINILAIIISDYTEGCLICHAWWLHDVNFILIVNTYMPILFTSFLHTSLNIQAILGDIHLLININSTSCQVWSYIYLYVIM